MSTLPNEPVTPYDRIENLLERVEKLEAELASLIADDTFVWRVDDGPNPVVARTGECTLVAVSVSAVIQDPAIHVLIYDSISDDPDSDDLRWVVPGPLELGAVPYVPIEFFTGVVGVVRDGTGDLIDPGDITPRLYVTFATNGGESPP